MNSTVDVTKNIDVTQNIDVVIPVSVDYVKCDECGQELDFDVSVDGFGDLQIKVAKCDCAE